MIRFSNFTDNELDAMEAAFCNEGLKCLVDEIRRERRYRESRQMKVDESQQKVRNKEVNMNDVNKHIWIVTYWTSEIEPIVTAFNNREAAQACCDYFSKEYSCCIDECNIYNSFMQN